MPRAIPRYFTESLLYKEYPHKRINLEKKAEGIRPSFFVRKAEHSNYKYAMTYEDFTTLSYDFFDELFDYLCEGKSFTVPYGMGEMRFVKIKRSKDKKFIDHKRTGEVYGEYNLTVPRSERKYIYHRNSHTGGYGVRFQWNINKRRLPFSVVWRRKLSRTSKAKLSQMLLESDDIVHKLNEK